MTVMVLFGIGSGLCWGVADFFGGLQARRLPALAVAFWSQIAGALALLLVLLAHGEAPYLRALHGAQRRACLARWAWSCFTARWRSA